MTLPTCSWFILFFLNWDYVIVLLNIVTTLALGLRPRQGHGKVWVESATQESHSHSWECERV
jgi:hypothetical protein